MFTSAPQVRGMTTKMQVAIVADTRGARQDAHAHELRHRGNREWHDSVKVARSDRDIISVGGMRCATGSDGSRC